MCYNKIIMYNDFTQLQVNANRGDAEAQFNLGTHYEARRDIQRAFYWINLAANQNHAPAQCVLGLYHREGYGTQIDMRQAVIWFMRAYSNYDDPRKHFALDGLYMCSMVSNDFENINMDPREKQKIRFLIERR